MSNREDYLDSLLSSVKDQDGDVDFADAGQDDDFLKEYDSGLVHMDDDSFLREFEKELEKPEPDYGFGAEEPANMDFSDFPEELRPTPVPQDDGEGLQDGFDDMMVDTMGSDDLAGFDTEGLDEMLMTAMGGAKSGAGASTGSGAGADAKSGTRAGSGADAKSGARAGANTGADAKSGARAGSKPSAGADGGAGSGQGSDASDVTEEDLAFLDNFNFKNYVAPGDKEGAKLAKEAEEAVEAAQAENEDDELLNLLAGMAPDKDLEDIGNMLKADDDGTLMDGGDDAMMDDLGMQDEDEEGSGGKKKKKKGKKAKEKKEKGKKEKKADDSSFMSKFSKILFGDDEEDEEVLESGEIGSISDENREILEEMDKAEKKKAKQEAKKAKQEAKKKAKKEKPKKEKKPKPPKEKKQKPAEPKEKSKPLPKLPVFLIFLMAGSLGLLVFLGSNLVGYSNAKAEAQAAYDRGDYVEAYHKLRGLNIKEADTELYERSRLVSYLQKEKDAYDSFERLGMYPEALDSLILLVGKYDKFYNEVSAVNGGNEFATLLSEAEANLNANFGVSLDEARQAYAVAIRDRGEYTKQVYGFLERFGISVAEAE